MSALIVFIFDNLFFDSCLALALLIFLYNFVILRKVNEKSDHFISGIPVLGPLIYFVGALTTPCKWLVIFVIFDPQVMMVIMGIPDIYKYYAEAKMIRRILLMKLEDIEEKDAELIAQMRDVRMFTAVHTTGTEVMDTKTIVTINPSFYFLRSDKDKAHDQLAKIYKIKTENIVVFDTINEETLRCARVTFMESLYDSALHGNAKREVFELLDRYLASGFKGDYEADEKGLFPSDLKRGVLSEDGLYNLLEERHKKKK